MPDLAAAAAQLLHQEQGDLLQDGLLQVGAGPGGCAASLAGPCGKRLRSCRAAKLLLGAARGCGRNGAGGGRGPARGSFPASRCGAGPRCGGTGAGHCPGRYGPAFRMSPAVCGAEWFLKPFLCRLAPKKAEVSLVSERYRTETIPGLAEPSGGCAAGPGAAGQGRTAAFGAAAPRSAFRSRAAAR